MKYSLAVLLFLTATSAALPQNCPGGVCPAPQVSAPSSILQWGPGDRPEVKWLYHNFVVVGGWNGEAYFQCKNGVWDKTPVELPLPLPPDAVKVKPKEQVVGDPFPGGVDVSKIKKGRTSINGKDVEESRAFEALTAGLVDDTKKLRLTVYGDDRDVIVSAWRTDAQFVDLRNAFHVHSYPKDHWAVKGVGLAVGEKGVVIQDSGGKVLHRSSDLDPAKLKVAAVAALRKANPNYNPENDPDLSREGPLPDSNAILSWLKAPGLFGLPNFVTVAAGVFLFLKFRKKKVEAPK